MATGGPGDFGFAIKEEDAAFYILMYRPQLIEDQELSAL